MTSYRYPLELLVLFITLSLILAVVGLTAVATVCTSLVFVLAAFLMAYSSSKQHHQALLQRAYAITHENEPQLAALMQRCVARLRPGPVQLFVTRSKTLNAYTFGLESPKVVVLYSSLFDLMDADELTFILGHELGHVALGHTWLNSLVGGVAGIPTSSGASVLLTMVLLWWNRTCEFSADRAGLIACGKPEKAVSALVKLVAGVEARSPADLERAYRQIDAEDDTLAGPLSEALATHPMLIRRINELRQWAASPEYSNYRSQADRLEGGQAALG